MAVSVISASTMMLSGARSSNGVTRQCRASHCIYFYLSFPIEYQLWNHTLDCIRFTLTNNLPASVEASSVSQLT